MGPGEQDFFINLFGAIQKAKLFSNLRVLIVNFELDNFLHFSRTFYFHYLVKISNDPLHDKKIKIKNSRIFWLNTVAGQ